MLSINHYFTKYALYQQFINRAPQSNLNIVVVIPCFNEPDIIPTLQSLKNCTSPNCSVEVIVVVNSSEISPENILNQNNETIITAESWILHNQSEQLHYYIIHVPDLPRKFAGVGFARKIGMDEALRRFQQLQKPDGIIVGYDADSLCDTNYLIEIEKHFTQNPKSNACSVYFEHPIEGEEFTEKLYSRIIQYELYLRYYMQALRFIKFPYSYHTIGSSFAVRASVYAKQGGMNRRQAGEDFYFLQKVIPLGNYHEINSTRVIPSPRPSDRVPFGTGAAIQKMISDENEYLTYHFDAFGELGTLFENRLMFYKNENPNFDFLPKAVSMFLDENHFLADLKKINQNSPNHSVFDKRFFDWFDAFRVLKFLNFSHETFHRKVPIGTAASQLLKSLKITQGSHSEKEILSLYRNLDRFDSTFV